MPIIDSEIEYWLSGGAANTDPDAALGGAIATAGSALTSGALNNLFDDTTGDESAAGDVEYRCIYVKNANGSITWENVVMWIATASASADSVYAIAPGGAGLNGTAEVIANESTAPSGETFASPASKGAGTSLGNIPAGQHYPIWIRKTITASASASNSDGPTIRCEGDTGA